MVVYNFKSIQVVPPAKDFVDIVLSRTQRKTPTVVHPQYNISRIRRFYMRKVKYTQTTINEKLTKILEDFPRMEEVHPFYADLINVLYDRDHYKLALGQVNTARNLIDHLGKDYVRLLKYGDSLYRCKQLKRAGMGRMCTLLKRLGPSMAYLEQVRQHLARLPSIDPNSRTLIMCGFPNVGKSSFMNKVTRANVEVHHYPFTTKSLYVGHMDYRYLRWQVIDTPGILDHPLQDRNNIEMQAITALAHLRAAILFFVDISETCGYSIPQQVALFKSISPLFTGKPLAVVLNKIDIQPLDQLSPAQQAELASLGPNVLQLPMSAVSEEGITAVTQQACDRLLELRVETKVKGAKGADILSKIHVAVPQPRDGKERPVFVPQSVVAAASVSERDARPPRKLLKEREAENGGAGVFQTDFTEYFMLREKEWNHDVIPEFLDGHNVADFIDADILEQLDALDREEEARMAALQAGDGDMDGSESESDLSDDALDAVREIRRQKELSKQRHHIDVGTNRKPLPKGPRPRSLRELEDELAPRGIDAIGMANAISAPRRGRSRTRRSADGGSGSDDSDGGDRMDGGRPLTRSESRSKSRPRSKSASRSHSHVPADSTAPEIKRKAEKARRRADSKLRETRRQGESDRHHYDLKPKHLFSGKRGNGTTDRR